MKSRALGVVVGVGVLYCVTGVVLGALAGQASTISARNFWRWGAWLVSICAFGVHIVFEQRRLRSTPAITALHVASASALGAFGLAVMANVHALRADPSRHSLLLLLSLVLWPLITALPAFVVALVAALLLARVWRTTT